MIIVFDTDCVLCSGWVRLILRYERAPVARFVSAWSDEGARLAEAHGLSVADLDETFLVVTEEGALLRSDAALAVLETLRAPLRWGRVLRILPRGLRDRAYTLIARNRYALFGRRDTCFLPPTESAHRFGAAAQPPTRS